MSIWEANLGWDYPAGVSDKAIDDQFDNSDLEREDDMEREEGDNDYEREEEYER